MITILHIRTTVEWFVKWREPASVQLEEGTEAIDNSTKERMLLGLFNMDHQNIWPVSVVLCPSNCEHWSDLTCLISCSSFRYPN